MWQQLLNSADGEWLRSNAEFRLSQLDAMDMIDALNVLADRYRARVGRPAPDWNTLARSERLPFAPIDPAGAPLIIDPATGRVGLGPDSPLHPLPDEPPPSAVTPSGPLP
jgi:hypothetical protein